MKIIHYPSSDEWTDKMWYIHILEYSLVIKRIEHLIDMTPWMNIILNEGIQKQRLHIG